MSESHSLREFTERFSLPQLVKVHEGYYDENQCTTMGADAVYNLLSLESVETVLLEDSNGKEARIPLDNPCCVERVAEEKFQQQELGIQELLTENNSSVKFVRVIKSDPNYETLIKLGDKLKIELRKKKSQDNFLPFKKVNDKGKTLWKVPASCEAKFQALLDGEELPLGRFVKKNKLPAYVCFIDNISEESTREDEDKRKGIERRHSQPLFTGVVKLKGILVDSFVTATTEDQGVSTKISLPMTLPISVVPVKMELLKSPFNEPDSTTTTNTKSEITEDYEDMTGYRAKTLKSTHPKTPPVERKKENNEKILPLADLEMGGQRVRQGNTYSPPPPTKVTRSKSVTEWRKGHGLFQRTMSNVELQTNTTDSEENVYDDLNFASITTDKFKNSSLSRLQRRRSDSSTAANDLNSNKLNLNDLLHVQAQTQEDENFQGKVETVSLQIRRTSPVCTKSCTKMNTFGRKGKTAGENESVPCDVNTLDSILESQSYSMNSSQQSTSVAVNFLFYGSEEMDLETPAALKPNTSLASQVRRTSGDTLPPLPKESEDKTAAKERLRLPGGKVRVLPTDPGRKGTIPGPPQRSDDQNQKTQSQLSSGNGFARNISIYESEVSERRNEKEPPPPLPLRNKKTGGSICADVPLTSRDNVVSCKEYHPVPSPRVKSRSFHGQEQGRRPIVSSSDGKAPVVSRGEQGAGATPCATDNLKSPGTQMKPNPPENQQTENAETPETRYNIPQDLSTLRVPEVLQCLHALNMQHFETIFRERQVDGSMLVCLDDEALQSFGMDRFYRLKLLRFIAGWRPYL